LFVYYYVKIDLIIKGYVYFMVVVMNCIGYDVVVFGNYEFNYGFDVLWVF